MLAAVPLCRYRKEYGSCFAPGFLPISGGLHTGSGRGGDWNTDWTEFFKENPDATRKQIMGQLRTMVKEYQLERFVPEDTIEDGPIE